MDELSRARGRARGRTIAAAAAAVLLLAVGCHLTLSRAGAAGAWLLAGAGGVLLVRRAWPRLRAAGKIQFAVSAAALALTVYFFASGVSRGGFDAEAGKWTRFDPSSEASGRLMQARAAWGVFREAPLFGAGGWGYRYLMADHLTPSERTRLSSGMANVHNDPLQFLAEFGLAGAGCIAVFVVALIRPVFAADAGRRPGPPRAAALLTVGALVFVALQSLVDLPFRSPAVTATWVCLWMFLSPPAATPFDRTAPSGRTPAHA